jgi:hypothetical protein
MREKVTFFLKELDWVKDYFTDLYLCLSIVNQIFNLKKQNHERIEH